MRDDGGSSIAEGGSAPGQGADALARIGEAMREIERAKQERAAEPIRAARVHLAAIHGAKKLRKRLS